jgi:hypothetical protein
MEDPRIDECTSTFSARITPVWMKKVRMTAAMIVSEYEIAVRNAQYDSVIDMYVWRSVISIRRSFQRPTPQRRRPTDGQEDPWISPRSSNTTACMSAAAVIMVVSNAMVS